MACGRQEGEAIFAVNVLPESSKVSLPQSCWHINKAKIAQQHSSNLGGREVEEEAGRSMAAMGRGGVAGFEKDRDYVMI